MQINPDNKIQKFWGKLIYFGSQKDWIYLLEILSQSGYCCNVYVVMKAYANGNLHDVFIIILINKQTFAVRNYF